MGPLGLGDEPGEAHNALDYLSSRVFATALRRAVTLLRAGAGTP